jgi:hypothetical protein
MIFFCKDLSWQIRELTVSKLLVRFPPHKRVSDLKNFPTFNQRKEVVQVGVMEWIRWYKLSGTTTATTPTTSTPVRA